MRLFAMAFLAGMVSAGSAAAADCPAPDKAPIWQIFSCELSRGTVDAASLTDPWDKLMVLDEKGASAVLDWETDTADILWQFEKMLAFNGLPVFTPQEETRLTGIGAAAWGKSTPMAELEPHLEKAVEARGAKLLYINSDSDSYVYAVVSDCLYRRWANVRLDDEFAAMPVDRNAMNLGFKAGAKSAAPRGSCGAAK